MFDYDDHAMLRYEVSDSGGKCDYDKALDPIEVIVDHAKHLISTPEVAKRRNLELQNDIKKRIGSREENMKKMLEIFNG